MAAAATAGGIQAAAVAAHPAVRAGTGPAAGGGADPPAGAGSGGDVLSRCGVGAWLTAHREDRHGTPRRSPATSRAR